MKLIDGPGPSPAGRPRSSAVRLAACRSRSVAPPQPLVRRTAPAPSSRRHSQFVRRAAPAAARPAAPLLGHPSRRRSPARLADPPLGRRAAPPPLVRHRPGAPRVAAAPLRAVGSQREGEGMVVPEAEVEGRPLRVGLVCGGPSAERGISLNSARSVLDHIQGEDLLVSCYYIDCGMNAYAISPAQLYSNTPSDFDFKLESLAQEFLSLSDFAEHLAANVDIVFPVIHGKFGEDGGVQGLLEKANVPFVGTPSNECRRAFDKYNASLELNMQGFLPVPNFLVEKEILAKPELEEWFESINLNKENGKVVVKPTRAGPSIGVVSCLMFSQSHCIRDLSNLYI